MNLIKNELGDITMLFHCCGLPSPRTLVQASSEVRDTMDLSVISHFWVSSFDVYFDIQTLKKQIYLLMLFL